MGSILAPDWSWAVDDEAQSHINELGESVCFVGCIEYAVHVGQDTMIPIIEQMVADAPT